MSLGDRSGSSGTGSVLPWIACVVIGVVLIVVGVAMHSRPLHRGGPIMLGILLVLGGGLRLVRGSRR